MATAESIARCSRHSWLEQVAPVKLLEGCYFDWVLPERGERAYFPYGRMKQELARLVAALRP